MIISESGTNMQARILVVAAALLAAGCNGNDSAAEEKAAPPPVVLGPESIGVADSVSLSTGPLISGALVPETSAQMRAEVAGAVLQVYAEEGQRVRRGDVLARIDDTALREAQLSARAAMRSAESAAQIATRNEERAVRLNEAGAIAERELEQSRLAATSAAGALADAGGFDHNAHTIRLLTRLESHRVQPDRLGEAEVVGSAEDGGVDRFAIHLA